MDVELFLMLMGWLLALLGIGGCIMSHFFIERMFKLNRRILDNEHATLRDWRGTLIRYRVATEMLERLAREGNAKASACLVSLALIADVQQKEWEAEEEDSDEPVEE